MRILMVGSFPPPIHGMSIANQMLYDGFKTVHHVSIWNTCLVKTFRIRNMEQQGRWSFSRLFLSIPNTIFGVSRILFSRKLNVIYITPGQSIVGYLRYIPFMWAARIRKIPYFVHIHGGYFRTMYDGVKGWKKKLIDSSFKGLAGAIVLGPSLKYMFKGLIPNEKIFICENGVEDEIFAMEEEIKSKIKCYKKDDTIRVVYLSNLIESKGILDLLEAVKILKNEGKKIHLDIAGAIEPVIESKVKTYLSELGDTVSYRGIVKGKEKKRLLLDNYIFCLPTYYLNEGQPISILEAMANGCLIVTTDHGGIKDIVDERYGIFVEKQNPKSIAEAISRQDLEKAILESWNEAKKKYQADKFVKRMEEILSSAKTRRK